LLLIFLATIFAQMPNALVHPLLLAGRRLPACQTAQAATQNSEQLLGLLCRALERDKTLVADGPQRWHNNDFLTLEFPLL
jgi:hypothetical protein